MNILIRTIENNWYMLNAAFTFNRCACINHRQKLTVMFTHGRHNYLNDSVIEFFPRRKISRYYVHKHVDYIVFNIQRLLQFYYS